MLGIFYFLVISTIATVFPYRAGAVDGPRTLYVSVDGDDAVGAGTIELPWRHLSFAFDRAHPGDAIVLRGGLYQGARITLSGGGDTDHPIIIRAFENETPILDGTGSALPVPDEAEDKSHIPSVLDLRFAHHVVIDGLEIVNSPGYGISTWDASNVVVRNCKVHRTFSRGLGGSGRNLVFENNDVFDAVLHNDQEAVFRANDQGLRRYWSAAAASWYRPDGSLSENISWIGNRIHDSWGEGLTALHVDGAVLRGNRVSNSYSILVYIDHSRNVTVDGNFIFHSNRGRVRRDTRDVSPGIMWAAESYQGTPAIMPENIIISNNVVANVSVGIGFWRDPNNSNLTNRYRNVTIANNLIYGVSILPVSVQIINAEGLGDSINLIVNNIIYQAQFLLDDLTTLFTLNIKNRSLWSVDHNFFPDGIDGIARDEFFSFLNNLVGVNPLLRDPRIANPLGLEGYAASPLSPVWNGGRPVNGIVADIQGRVRNPQGPWSVGPWGSCSF